MLHDNGDKLTALSRREKHHSLPGDTTRQQMVESRSKGRNPLGPSSKFAQIENKCFERPFASLASVQLSIGVGDKTSYVAQSKPSVDEQSATVFNSPSKCAISPTDDQPLQVTPSKQRMTFIKDDPALPETPSKRMTFIKDDPGFPDTPSKRATFIKGDPGLPDTPIRRTTFGKLQPAMPNTPTIVTSPESPVPLRAKSAYGVINRKLMGRDVTPSPTLNSLTEVVDGCLEDELDSVEENAENIDPEKTVGDVLAARFVRLRQLADDSDSEHSEESDCSFTSPHSTHYESALSGSDGELSEGEVFEDSLASLPVVEIDVKVRQMDVDRSSGFTEECPVSERENFQDVDELPLAADASSTHVTSKQESSDETPSLVDQQTRSVTSASDYTPDSLPVKSLSPSLVSCDAVASSSFEDNRDDCHQSHACDWYSPTQLLEPSTQQTSLHLPDNVTVEMQRRLSSTPLARPPSIKGFVCEMSTLAEMPSPIIGQRVDQSTVTKCLGPSWIRPLSDTDNIAVADNITFDHHSSAVTTVSDIHVVNTVTVTKSKCDYIFEESTTAANPSKELFPSQYSHSASVQRAFSETTTSSRSAIECDISGVKQITHHQNAMLGKRSFAQSGSKARSDAAEFLHPTSAVPGRKRVFSSGVTRNANVAKKVKTSRTVGPVSRSVSLTSTQASSLTRSATRSGIVHIIILNYLFIVFPFDFNCYFFIFIVIYIMFIMLIIFSMIKSIVVRMVFRVGNLLMSYPTYTKFLFINSFYCIVACKHYQTMFLLYIIYKVTFIILFVVWSGK